jgi:hypothetical protein
MHVSTSTHKSVSVKIHPPRGRLKGGKMGREARAKGLYIGPISFSERAPYVAISLKVTYGNVEKTNKIFACGWLSSVLGQISLKIGPASCTTRHVRLRWATVARQFFTGSIAVADADDYNTRTRGKFVHYGIIRRSFIHSSVRPSVRPSVRLSV